MISGRSGREAGQATRWRSGKASVPAAAAAERLGLAYDYRFTGYGGLGGFIDRRLDLEEIREQAEGDIPEVAAWLS